MSTSYKEMWNRLGLDLEGHDQLLQVLGRFYTDIYLSQKHRPAGTRYLDFVISEIHGLRIRELVDARNEGKKIIGTFCVFVPEELILAAGAVNVGLCAGAEIGKDAAEKVLPRNTCALIKSFVGFKLSKLCPYFETADLVVGETTCDGKKKAYEIFSEHVPLYVMEIPQMKKNRDRDLWKGEVLGFRDELERITGNQITASALKDAIGKLNRRRGVLQRLDRLRRADPAPISGRDAVLVNQIAFYDDPDRFTGKISELCDELEGRVENNEGVTEKGLPRIMIAGCPMAAPNWKLPFLIETSGAVLVGEESCVGRRNTRDLVDESEETLEGMIDAIVDRYMKIDCACFTPNEERIDNILDMAGELEVDGVVYYNISFCQPYEMEAMKMEPRLREAGIPMLNIDTDYSMEDVEQLKTRIEAFVEMIG